MSLTSDIQGIKTIHDGVKNNKVTRFAYTETAYTNNDANGHTDYVPARDNNIPTDDIAVMNVNQTVVNKGFRARASSLTRMLLNHLFGRISYNLNKVNDLFNSLLSVILNNMGVADGLATLDENGRIPYSQLPEDAIEFKGEWNASTNTPTLADGTGTKGDTYVVSVAGTQDLGSGSTNFQVNDRVIYNGSVWQRFPAGDVKTVSEVLPDTNGNVDLSTQTDVTKILNASLRGTANNLATLDANGKLPASQLTPDAVKFKGDWDASTNTPTLADGTGNKGDMYNVSVAGTQDLGSGDIAFRKDSKVMYNGSVWVYFPSSTVLTVSEVQPDSTGNVDLSKQTDLTKIFNNNFLTKLLTTFMVRQWKQVTGDSASVAVSVILKINGLFVACSGHGCWWSEDGKAWTQGTGANTTYVMQYLVYANGLWVCGSYNHGLWWSEDGKSWTQGTGSNTTYTTHHLVYANGLWVCGSDSHGLWWSEDGKSWTKGTGSNTAYTMQYLVYANGLWVCGSKSHGMWWSTGGKAWTQGTGSNTSYTMQNLVYANGLWICGSNVRGIWRSTDGKAWTQVTAIGDSEVASVTYINNLWIVGLGTASNYWSEDGTSWTQCTLEANSAFWYIVYDNGIYVAGSQGTGLGTAMWSTNGKTWYNSNLPTARWQGTIHANGVWLIFKGSTSSGCDVYWSTDGRIWTQAVIGTVDADVVMFDEESRLWLIGSWSKGIWYSGLQEALDYINGDA